MNTYYLDTSIWLNLFKKEESKKVEYWRIAREFLEKVMRSQEKIIVSTIVLKEIFFVAPEQFRIIKEFFKTSKYIEIIKTSPEDYEFARTLEKETKYILSFYDYLHIAISKRTNSLLITRDKELLILSKRYIFSYKPEELLN